MRGTCQAHIAAIQSGSATHGPVSQCRRARSRRSEASRESSGAGSRKNGSGPRSASRPSTGPTVDSSAMSAATIPYAWYSDEDVFRREQERIFEHAWHYAGHADEVAERGTYLTTQAGRVPLVVIRGRDDELRCFVNVCRHRGFEVAQGCGRRETLQCAYHAWTYDLDGSLRAAPRSDGEPDFDKAELGLKPAQVGAWGPFVFVNADAGAPSLEETLADLPAQVAEAGLDVDGLAFNRRVEFELEANWKVIAENFLECYHCQVAHPGFSAMVDVSR